MPRYHNINGNQVQFTAEEETARDNEEAAWANAAPARALATLRDLPDGKDTVDKCNNATWPTKP